MYPFSIAEVVEFFRQNYGPMVRTFAALEADQQVLLRQDLEKVFSNHNRSKDAAAQLEGEYLEVIAVRP
jgi:hypothetical protein